MAECAISDIVFASIATFFSVMLAYGLFVLLAIGIHCQDHLPNPEIQERNTQGNYLFFRRALYFGPVLGAFFAVLVPFTMRCL